MNITLAIFLMAAVTYLIRMLPFTLLRKKIRNRFFRSLLYYLPFAILSAMTIPAIFYSTGSIAAAVAGTVVACALAFFELPLIAVALAAAAVAFLSGFVM